MQKERLPENAICGDTEIERTSLFYSERATILVYTRGNAHNIRKL